MRRNVERASALLQKSTGAMLRREACIGDTVRRGYRLARMPRGMNQSMNVVGVAGEKIGTVERFELDRRGQLSSLVIRIASSIGTRKRIAVEQIRSIRGSTVTVDVTAAEVRTLADLPPNDDQPLDQAS
jgi:hypothetical protein